MVDEQPGAIEQASLRFQVGIYEEAIGARPDDAEALRFLSHAYATLGRHAEGLRADRRLVELLPQDERARYNLACSLVADGQPEAALQTLAEAIRLGFCDLSLMRKDADLDLLRSDPRFQAVLADLARRLGRQ